MPLCRISPNSKNYGQRLRTEYLFLHRYLLQRQQFGTPIANFQGMQFTYAEAATGTNILRCEHHLD